MDGNLVNVGWAGVLRQVHRLRWWLFLLTLTVVSSVSFYVSQGQREVHQHRIVMRHEAFIKGQDRWGAINFNVRIEVKRRVFARLSEESPKFREAVAQGLLTEETFVAGRLPPDYKQLPIYEFTPISEDASYLIVNLPVAIDRRHMVVFDHEVNRLIRELNQQALQPLAKQQKDLDKIYGHKFAVTDFFHGLIQRYSVLDTHQYLLSEVAASTWDSTWREIRLMFHHVAALRAAGRIDEQRFAGYMKTIRGFEQQRQQLPPLLSVSQRAQNRESIKELLFNHESTLGSSFVVNTRARYPMVMVMGWFVGTLFFGFGLCLYRAVSGHWRQRLGQAGRQLGEELGG